MQKPWDPNRINWLHTQLETWKKLAPDYSKLNWVQNQDLIEQMINFCEPQRSWITVDVGTGHGTIAAALESKIARVTGIDVAPEMIKQAVERHGHTCIRVDEPHR